MQNKLPYSIFFTSYLKTRKLLCHKNFCKNCFGPVKFINCLFEVLFEAVFLPNQFPMQDILHICQTIILRSMTENLSHNSSYLVTTDWSMIKCAAPYSIQHVLWYSVQDMLYTVTCAVFCGLCAVCCALLNELHSVTCSVFSALGDVSCAVFSALLAVYREEVFRTKCTVWAEQWRSKAVASPCHSLMES